MRKEPTLPLIARIALAFLILVILGGFLYQSPSIRWQVDLALTYLRGEIHPVGEMPTPLPYPTLTVAPTQSPTAIPFLTPTQPGPTPTLIPSPTPLPQTVLLSAPAYEAQDWNNCGPATLAMYLRYYGWEGDQKDIAKVIKPVREDRNVNVEELVYYVRTRAGWLNAEYRVGGNVDLLKKLLANGFPVVIEESTTLDRSFWSGDDQWAGHYLLLLGYDETSQQFAVEDSFVPQKKTISYVEIDQNWQAFNRVFILVYLPSQQQQIESLLGDDWDPDLNRQRALETAQTETNLTPDNPFAWFNLGSNLVYFERYGEAAMAYDKAISLGLPQRMLLYQFGPFFAYFHSGRTNDLLNVTNYVLTLPSQPVSEEPLLWHGWALYRLGKVQEAIADWRKALEANPNYQDAIYALNFVGVSP